jgi:hypothetical protein
MKNRLRMPALPISAGGNVAVASLALVCAIASWAAFVYRPTHAGFYKLHLMPLPFSAWLFRVPPTR